MRALFPVASAGLRQHGAGKGGQAGSALRGCTSDIHRLLTLPPGFGVCQGLSAMTQAPRIASVAITRARWRGHCPCPAPSILLQALPRVNAVLDIRHPGVLLQRVNGLQDVLSPILHLQAMQDSIRLGSCHPPQGKAHPITQPEPHIHLLLGEDKCSVSSQ